MQSHVELEEETARGAVQSVIASSSPMFPGCPGLFLQCRAEESELNAAAPLMEQEGVGVVATLGRRDPPSSDSLRKVLCTPGLREDSAHVLIDAARYSGVNRRVATRLDPEWINAQRRGGLSVALTDSPYLPEGDYRSLVGILGQARGFGEGVIVVLPLHLHWLTDQRARARLLDAVNRAGVPVALALEHNHDPLGVQTAVAGLVEVLEQASVKVLLLRSDLAAIGAVAFGATLGAVGTATSLRHVFPLGPSSGSPAKPAALAPGMAYRQLDKISLAVSADTDDQQRWMCCCTYCYGRQISQIADETHAYLHSLAKVAEIARTVLGGPPDVDRRTAWLDRCRLESTVNREIADTTGQLWTPPKFLGAWLKLRPSLAGV